MYDIYLWKIKPLSSYITPWQSDTIYGHFLWAISLLFGENEIKKTIEEFKSLKSPFIVSDGFIDGKLPFLKKAHVRKEINKKFAKDLNISLAEVIIKRKYIDKISHLNIDEFNKLRDNYTNEEFIFDKLKTNQIEEINKSSSKEIVTHNTINRCSGSTTSNDLYFSKETFTDKDIFIFIKLRKDYPLLKMKEILKFVENNGYGKKSSTGKGNFKTLSFEKFDGFPEIKNANGFVTLSNYIPKEFDYSKVIFEVPLIKFGKIANFGKNAEVPFKKPFACFSAGSIFKKGDAERYGKVLENIHYDNSIVQIGIPFTLEVKL